MLTTRYLSLNEVHQSSSYWSTSMTNSLLEMMRQHSTLSKVQSARDSKPLTWVRPPGSSEYMCDMTYLWVPCSSTKCNTSRVSCPDMVWMAAICYPRPSLHTSSFNLHPPKNMPLFLHIPTLKLLVH